MAGIGDLFRVLLDWIGFPALAAATLAAQATPPESRQAGPPAYRVVLAKAPLRLDAKAADPVWQSVDSVVDFRQREPREGEPASERTVVKMVRDGNRFYVAVRAYQSDMRHLRATQLRRDADLSTDDNITVLIDSYHDRRGAFLFRTNPNGAMWDAQLTGFDNINENWNGVWEVATGRDSVSWFVEFAIPLQTLRFRPGNDVIGLNIERQVRRKNEDDLWRSWGRAQGIENLVNTADAGGFGDIRGNRPIELRPYAVGRAVAASYDSAGGPTGGARGALKAGLDAKVAVTPTITADLTANTDFSEVEVDQQVINLTRFPTFFPEKRQFFLESSGLFDLGTPERTQLFYSRRIGLDSTGAPVPIVGGVRAFGKAGPWGIGLLGVRTGGNERANDVAIRLSHDLLDRSSIAAMFVDHAAAGAGDELGAGVDLDFPLIVRRANVEPHFWMMGTHTSAASGTPVAWRLSTDAPNDLFDAFVSLYSIDPGFNPTMGFVRRTGIRETTGHIDFQPRPKVLGIRQLDLTPIPSWDIITDRQNSLTDPSTWQTADFEWHVLAGDMQSGDHFEVNVRRELDAPTAAFEIFRGTSIQPGRYWWTSADAQVETSPGRPVSVAAAVSTGQLYDGHSSGIELGGTVRAGGHAIVAVSYTATTARLPAGRFTAVEASGRVEYAFSPRADFLVFAQYGNADRRVDFDLRFHWIPKPGDDVYAVWSSGYTTDPAAPWRFPDRLALSHPLNAAFAIKAVHYLTP